MKKGSLIGLTVLCVIALTVWFSCNPFSTSKTDSTSFDVLDQTSGARLSITCTIEVNGATWNGGGVSIVAGSNMGDGTQNEHQAPIFEVTNGTVTNCTISPPACDGIHLMGGNCTVSSVTVPDVGEDVVSVKAPGTYNVSNCTFNNGDDKITQHNDLCTITYTNVNSTGMSKFARQNGGKTWTMTIYINGCTLNNISECIWRSDSSSSICYYRNITSNLPSSSWWYSGAKAQAY